MRISWRHLRPSGVRSTHRSIRVSVALWYVGILAVILAVFSVALYTTVAAGLTRDINRGLALQSEGIAKAIYAFWRAERTNALSGPGNWQAAPPGNLLSAIDTGSFSTFIGRWADKTQGLQTLRPIRILGRDGTPVRESFGVRDLMFPDLPDAIEQARDGHQVFDTVPHGHGQLRVLTHPVHDMGRLLYFVQVASPLDAMAATLARLRLWLLWLAPLTLLVTSVVGWGLASRALRPVGGIIAQAQQIGTERLDARVDVPETGDELEALARTFNDMLGRIEDGFRRLRQFSAAASHELRTPLTVMQGELELALRRERSGEEYRDTLNRHLAVVTDMAQTVETLLSVARAGAMSGSLDWQSVELGGLLNQVAAIWRKIAAAKRVAVTIDANGPVWVRGERRLLERLVANLIDNAIRFTPLNGSVTLSAAAEGVLARLSVKDTGPGIAPEELPRIFDRFFRRPSAAVSSSTGLGLGLCRWIAEAHQGRIDVASTPGRGTTFTVFLPLSASQ
ncbi:MAG TPA: ATP-binding protein [bacterium]